jgi:Cdc6-like AAA superfamily ATPase
MVRLPSGELPPSWSSPFSALPRWEVENPHFYHIPDDLRSELEAEGSVYLLGTRGTGKTTLLKSVQWNERVSNDRLRAVVGSPSNTGLVGLYQKVPEARFDLLGEWMLSESQSLRIVAAYLDCFRYS